jgi:enterochelin esterase family protein
MTVLARVCLGVLVFSAAVRPGFAQGVAAPQAPVAAPAGAPGPRPPAPTRDPKTPGYVTATDATELPDGAVPPVDKNGNFVLGPTKPPAPEMTDTVKVPHGMVHTFMMDSTDSAIYPGIARKPGTRAEIDPTNPARRIVQSGPAPYTRRVAVYIPQQYVKGTVAPFIVGADGPDPLLFTALDNLIAQKRVPVMVAISIANGSGDAQGSQRGLEYDTMSGRYAEFVETEVLPKVEKMFDLKLTKNPAARATMGCSSGASAALAMAWYRTDLYHRVLSYSGTFVNQQYPWNPETPGGAWDFHRSLIPKTPKKPLRVWLQISDRDNFNDSDGMHDWVLANQLMAKELAAKGYPYQLLFSKDAGHCDRATKLQTLPQALEWLWKDYVPGK